jgi:DNA-binding MarR family transcriptional regulator
MAKKRRKSDPVSRLSEQQKAILSWMGKNYSEHIGLERPGNSTLTNVLMLPWEPSLFIGENPTPSKRAALSASLRGLAERGLVERLGTTGRGRTTYVSLTKPGRLVAEKLINQSFNPANYEREGELSNLERRIEGLQIAKRILDKALWEVDISRRAGFVEGGDDETVIAFDRAATEEARALGAVEGALQDSIAQKRKLVDG